MPLDKEYWESLDVCVADIIEDENRLPSVEEHVANKLESAFGNCNSLIKEYYDDAKGSYLSNTVSSLYIHNKADFRELYALAKYSENKRNSRIIEEVTAKHLKHSNLQQVLRQTKRTQSLLLPLFKKNPDALYDIHYAHILQSKRAKQYDLVKRLDEPISFELLLDKDKIDVILKEIEDKSNAKVKLQTKVWRYKPTEESTLIVFRKEKKQRSENPTVDKNEFHKSGVQKIISFRDGGSILLVSSKDKKTVKIAEYIVYKVTNQRLRYEQHLNQCELQKFKGFIDNLASYKIKDCSLTSVRVQNVGLKHSSPTIEVFCDEDAVPAINDLDKDHTLSLLDKPEEFLGFKIILNENPYSIRTIINGSIVTFSTDNRNIREENKDELSKFFDKHLG